MKREREKRCQESSLAASQRQVDRPHKRSKYFGVWRVLAASKNLENRCWRVEYKRGDVRYRGTYHHTEEEDSTAVQDLARQMGHDVPVCRRLCSAYHDKADT